MKNSNKFVFYKQLNTMDCGPACLKMVARYYGVLLSTDFICQRAGFNKAGVSLLGISETAEQVGFRTRGVKITFNQLKEVTIPCILHWDQSHFVVLLSVTRSKVKIADPAKGIHSYNWEEFKQHWISTKD